MTKRESHKIELLSEELVKINKRLDDGDSKFSELITILQDDANSSNKGVQTRLNDLEGAVNDLGITKKVLVGLGGILLSLWGILAVWMYKS